MKSFLLTLCVIFHISFLLSNSCYAIEKSAKEKIHDTEIGFQQRWNDKSSNPTNFSKMIAVHCSAGAGRTGTFIAAYLLIDEINRQIDNGIAPDNLNFSIDKIIGQISLQRPFMITHFPQYRALYELANYYTKLKQTNGIKTIVFDFGGVVAKANDANMKQFLMDSFNITREDLGNALRAMRKQRTEGLSEETFWKQYAISRDQELPIDWFDQYSDIIRKAIKEIPKTIAIVKALQQQGYQTAMLSDITQKQASIVQNLGYYDLFDPVLLSCNTGIKKPDPQAFHTLIKRLNQSPSLILFIDDRIENVEAAQKEGIDSIQFLSPEQLKQELESRGIIFHVSLITHNAIEKNWRKP